MREGDMNSTTSPASDLSELLFEIDREITGELRERSVPTEFGPTNVLEDIGRHICFNLVGRHLAIPLPLVLEVGELETIRPLPFLPGWIDGVTNIRGEIVSVTNLTAFFNLPGESKRKNRTFIIIHAQGMKTAVTVDRITGTRLLYRKEEPVLRENPKKNIPADFLTGGALFFSENIEKELEIFDGKKLLSSIQL